jgi:phosphate transport system permease protein
MSSRAHPFQRQATFAAQQETAVFWALRGFTYLILFFAVVIFSIIIYKGAPAVLDAFRLDGTFPYLHNDFLFTKPQTLHVFTYKGQIKQMSAEDYYKFVGQTPDATTAPAPVPVTAQTASTPATAPAPSSVPATTPLSPASGSAVGTTKPATPATPAQAPPSSGSALGTAGSSASNASATTAPVAPPPPPAPVLSSTGINPADITDEKTYSYAAGGIWPQIVGTILLVIGSMAIALVLGIFSAVYLSEYSRQGPIISAIRLAIINLAGVPSIVFGLFGVGLFVIAFGWNVSLMAGWFTLAFMVLPVIITASEESLRAVPKGFREGSLALGATKWQTIYLNVLPYALPGILTSSVLGIARVAGETAPILFTAAYATSDKLPWEIASTRFPRGFVDWIEYPFAWPWNMDWSHLGPNMAGWIEYPFAVMHHLAFSGVNALPYHIYVVSSKIPQNEYTERVQYGTAFVFLAVVMSIALASIILRLRLRRRLKW